ncbi:MAG: PQQ-binding-like beta-propeller repeat protein [candidate division WOR-3 bacterium]
MLLATFLTYLSLIGVDAPGTPAITAWPLFTDTSTEVTIKVLTNDPKKREVAYMIDWGDGSPLGWSRYMASGTEVEHYHTYTTTGTMVIRVRASAHAFATTDTQASAWSKPCTLRVYASLVKWKFPVPAGTFCAPALDSAGNIYFGDEAGWFYSLTPEGTLRWRFRVLDTLEGAISAAAAIGNGMVYFPCEDMRIYALTLDGKLVWSYKTATPATAAPTPGADGMIYCADDSGIVYCLNNQGILKWTFVTNDEIDNGLAIGADGTIYVPADSMYALTPTGRRLWAQGAQEEDNPFYGVSIGPDNDVYGTNKDGYLYRLDAKTGRIVWRVQSGDEEEIHTEAVFGPDNTIYFGSDDYYVNAKPKDGPSRILIETDDKIQATPAVNANGTVYFFSHDGFFYCLAPNGAGKWKRQIGSGDYD